MTIIAVDIGNSRTHLAAVDNRKVLKQTDIPHDRSNQFGEALKTLSTDASLGSGVPVVVCSVVPEITQQVIDAARTAMNVEAKVIGVDIPLPLRLDLDDATTVGADRVVSAAMACERMQTAVVVVDCGTAITVDCVNREGVFVGGAIMPGLRMALTALAEKTRALPAVEPAELEGSWGRNTEQAILHGVIRGSAGAVRGLVEAYATVLGYWPDAIATGGDAPLIAKYADFIHAVVPELQMMGIELTYDLWRQGRDDER